jgi:hypothetical protein
MLSTVNPQTVNLQLPVPQQASPVKPSWAIPASPFIVTAENLVVVLNCSEPHDPPALCLYDREGALQKKVLLGTVSRQSDPLRPVDLALSEEGTIVVLYTKSWLATDGGVMTFDTHLTLLSVEPRTWVQPVRGLTTARGVIVIADEKQMYIYDRALRLQYREGVQSAERGRVQLTRIKADARGDYLYLVDKAYHRILRYHLPTRQWVSGYP